MIGCVNYAFLNLTKVSDKPTKRLNLISHVKMPVDIGCYLLSLPTPGHISLCLLFILKVEIIEGQLFSVG